MPICPYCRDSVPDLDHHLRNAFNHPSPTRPFQTRGMHESGPNVSKREVHRRIEHMESTLKDATSGAYPHGLYTYDGDKILLVVAAALIDLLKELTDYHEGRSSEK